MKKSILNLGSALNKVEQKEINGGMGATLCTHCGYITPYKRTCIINGSIFVEDCIPR